MMPDVIERRFLYPPMGRSTEDERLGFLRESKQQGESYLKNQRAWPSIQRGPDIIADIFNDPSNPSLSRVRYNLPKRVIREIVATLSNLRIAPNYRASNEKYSTQANILNKRLRAWYQQEHVSSAIKECLQWATACGKGYGYLGYGRRFIITGAKDSFLEAKGPADVIPVQMGPNHELQKAYQVHIIHELPYFEAAMRFPGQEDWLARSAKAPSIIKRTARRFLSPILRMAFGPRATEEPDTFPLVPLVETYTLDTSLNLTGLPMEMGDPNTNWNYFVYPRGGTMPTGAFDPVTGQELNRDVRDEDALMFPARRVTWWNDDHVFEDGPSHWAHGYLPLVEFAFDEWPFDFLGWPLTHDIAPLARSIREGLRVIDDVQNVRTRPPYAYHKDRVARSLIESLDPRVPLQAVGIEGIGAVDLRQVIQPIFSAEYYTVADWQMKHLAENERRIERLSGVADAIALTKMRQMPSGDTIEKLGELLGPMVAEYSRSMVRPITDLGVMLAFNFLQFDSLDQRFHLLGEDAFTDQDFDYSPASLTPHDDDPSTKLKTAWDRIRAHANVFQYVIDPQSLHEITSLTRKLVVLQLAKIPDFPIDIWSIARVMGVELGNEPDNTHTPLEKYWEYKRLAAKATAEIMKEFGVMPGGAVGPHGGRRGSGGRPGSGGAPPRIKNKPNGGSTVQESR